MVEIIEYFVLPLISVAIVLFIIIYRSGDRNCMLENDKIVIEIRLGMKRHAHASIAQDIYHVYDFDDAMTSDDEYHESRDARFLCKTSSSLRVTK
ncbi:unnamed protein product [Linum trigynum]|uniref:Uncharacterized protein n=1 Tax=Linum trigynum TaxID=586398 RepID=A0AAV2GNR7_9ROSI